MNGTVFDPTQRTAPGPQPPTIMRPVSNPWKEERPGFQCQRGFLGRAPTGYYVSTANRRSPRARDLPLHTRNSLDARSLAGNKGHSRSAVEQRDSGSNLMMVDAHSSAVRIRSCGTASIPIADQVNPCIL